MTNTVIRHYGTNRSDVPHLVTSHKCRVTVDPEKVTCPKCAQAPAPPVIAGVVVMSALVDPDGAA